MILSSAVGVLFTLNVPAQTPDTQTVICQDVLLPNASSIERIVLLSETETVTNLDETITTNTFECIGYQLGTNMASAGRTPYSPSGPLSIQIADGPTVLYASGDSNQVSVSIVRGPRLVISGATGQSEDLNTWQDFLIVSSNNIVAPMDHEKLFFRGAMAANAATE